MSKQYIKVFESYQFGEQRLYETFYENSEKILREIKDYELPYYTLSENGNCTLLAPQPCVIENNNIVFKPKYYEKKVSDSLKEYYSLSKKTEDSAGFIKPQYLFIANNYFEKILPNYVQYRKWMIDIKTGTDKSHLDKNNKIVYDGVVPPNLETCDFPFLAMTIHDSIDNIYYSFGFHDYTPKPLKDEKIVYKKCNDEACFFESFLELLESKKPDIMSAWDGDIFVFPAFKRIEKILGKNSYYKVSPFRKTHKEKLYPEKSGYEPSYLKPADFYWTDMKNVYKNFILEPRESYSLEMIAIAEGLEIEYKEENFQELHNEHFECFINYNIQNVRILVQLEEKLNLLKTMQSLQYEMGCNFDDMTATVTPWNTYLYCYGTKHKNMIIQNVLNNKGGKKNGKYIGGWVEIVQGNHKAVSSYDFEALYPNIQISMNISPEMKIESKYLNDELKRIQRIVKKYQMDMEFFKVPSEELIEVKKTCQKYNVVITPNGIFYSREKQGIVPEILDIILKERSIAKNKMLAIGKIRSNIINNSYFIGKERFNENLFSRFLNSEKIKIKEFLTYLKSLKDSRKYPILQRLRKEEKRLELYQNTKKAQANSEYGFIGNEWACIFDLEMATSMTTTGRSIVKYIRDSTNDFFETHHDFRPFIYADTDSIEANANVHTEKYGDIEIEDLYNKCRGKEFIKGKENYLKEVYENLWTNSYHEKMQPNHTNMSMERIRSISKHKIKKEMFELEIDGNILRVTADHSLQVLRNKKLIEVSVKDLLSDDEIVLNT